jgi:hypothetical protein
MLGSLQARDAIKFPGGDNSSDTLIDGRHFNISILQQWNYTLYSNGTISNGSYCFITFAPYTPTGLLSNGTFLNSTWCYSPVRSIGPRASIGVGFVCMFGLGLLLSLASLTKLGRLHLPASKRFFPIGRRWQWYWAIFVCATAIISLVSTVDVDRYYLPEIPLIITNFFWLLMEEATLALVWEAVRHWGSWRERQIVDASPFALRIDDRRAKVEFWMPLVFYFWLWMVNMSSLQLLNVISLLIKFCLEFLPGYASRLGSHRAPAVS